jgi:hypothetical protein
MNSIAVKMEQNKKDIKALNLALSSRKMARTQRKHYLPDLAPEYILQAIETPLSDSIHITVQSMIKGLNVSITDMLRTDHADMYNTIWPKLSLTLQVVDKLTAMVVQEDSRSG